ncbi:MAG: hypothetical protein IT559_04070 [Alphaproteobacteria bacterium]|nr:hypothetical protein [Alphaproteobacteria bacterium]
MQKESLKIGGLVVVDFRTEQLTDAIVAWRDQKHIPYAESCARQVWYGDSCDFESFPVKGAAPGDFSFHEGTKGYAFLMKLNLGLLSKKQGEVNIKGQFYSGWEKTQRELPLSRQGYYDRFVQWITADTRLVQGSILGTFIAVRKELSARDLSGLKSNDRILIFGNIPPNGSVSSRSDGIARVCSSNTGRKAAEIAVTHPDSKVLGTLFNHFSALRDNGKVVDALSMVGFENLPLAVEKYDRVFVDRLSDDDAGANQQLVSAWRGRMRRDNMMVHMQAPSKMARSWKRMFGDNYVSPRDISADMGARASHNRKIVAEAEEAIKIIADLRMRGVQPSKRALAGLVSEMALVAG